MWKKCYNQEDANANALHSKASGFPEHMVMCWWLDYCLLALSQQEDL